MSDTVKYRAMSFKKDQIAALYFTMSDIVHWRSRKTGLNSFSYQNKLKGSCIVRFHLNRLFVMVHSSCEISFCWEQICKEKIWIRFHIIDCNSIFHHCFRNKVIISIQEVAFELGFIFSWFIELLFFLPSHPKCLLKVIIFIQKP